ncbi:MAG: glycosyltransferase family 2 protein [Chitinophagaceae bacterium]|nr:glycosyltransferase family 2 protein [Chitinophagaceae bacterium]
MTKPGYSIIIVNYKTPRLLADCLRTVFAQPTSDPFEVIVVDNASGDDSQSLICTEFPQVKWVQMQYNAGFARGNNEGMKQASGDVFLLLNSDTLISDNAIGNCYRTFITTDYVACGVQLLNADGSPQISGAYFMKGGLNHLLALPYLGGLIKFAGNLVKVKKPSLMDASTTIEVDWINGAFMMVKRTAVDRAGMMDEDFFLYAEEIEWCSRLYKIGKLAIFGQYNIVHLQGETANETFGSNSKGYQQLYDRKGFQIMISNFLRVRKQYGAGWYLLLLCSFTFAVPVYFIVGLIDNLLHLRNPFRHFGLASKLAANVGRCWMYAPKMLSKKPWFYKVL